MAIRETKRTNVSKGSQESPNQLDIAKKRIGKALKGFSNEMPTKFDISGLQSHRTEAEDFPVPELVLFLLRNVMGWTWSGVGEKVRWTVYGSLADEPIAFELRKFGFTILRAKNSKIPYSRIVGQLHAALREVEKLLEPFARQQLSAGEVLIVNRFGEFDGRYRFFRSRADKAYARAKRPPKPKKRPKGDFLGIADQLNHMSRLNHEGFVYSIAMIDAYFSALEHRLVLLRAFSGKPLQKDGLFQLLDADWAEKLKIVLSSVDDVTGDVIGRMRRIKERIRNPFAHGGVENDGGSLFFHLPGVGALPANFSKFGDSIRFSFIPIEAGTHADVCDTFDKLDKLLTLDQCAAPNKLLEAGVDPSFDKKHLKMYADAIAGSEEELNAFIARWSDDWMRHANMDY